MPDDDDDDGDADDSPVLPYVRHDSLKGKGDLEGSQVAGSKREVSEVRSTLVCWLFAYSFRVDRLSPTSSPLRVTIHFVTQFARLR